jgi:hypothetical protein
MVWVRVLGGVAGRSSSDPEALDGCDSPRAEATPPLNLAALAEPFRFEWERSLYSICDGDWAEVAACVPAPWGLENLRPLCFDHCAADLDPDTPGTQPDCIATANGEPLPHCSETDDESATCYQLRTDQDTSFTCVEDGANVELELQNRDPGTCYELTCQISTDRSTDCPDRP